MQSSLGESLRLICVRKLFPGAVAGKGLSSGRMGSVLKTGADVDAWAEAQKSRLLAALKNGPVQIS